MRFFLILTMVLGMVVGACNNEATVTVKKEDSLKNKVESTENGVDSSAKSLKDSAMNRSEEIRKKVEDRMEGKDTTTVK